jgi:hypothetical protein
VRAACASFACAVAGCVSVLVDFYFFLGPGLLVVAFVLGFATVPDWDRPGPRRWVILALVAPGFLGLPLWGLVLFSSGF